MNMFASLSRLWSAAAVVCLFAVSLRAQLVTNGGFESTPDFTGWTLSGNNGFISITDDAHSGTRAASFGAVGSQTFLAQTVVSTIPGATYALDFWLKNLGDGSPENPNLFTVSWDGNQLASLSNEPAFGYTEFSYQVTATSSSTVLQFGFQHNPSFWHFDDVSVTETSRGVPDSTSSVLLLGTALVGLGVFQRKRRAAR
jgi:hypothetical protein